MNIQLKKLMEDIYIYATSKIKNLLCRKPPQNS